MNPNHHQAEHPIKKIARWSLWSALGLMALMLAMHFLLPSLVNSRPVKAKIIAAAEAGLKGQFDYEMLRPRLLPLPSVVLTQVRLHIPDKLNVKALTIAIHPKILPLLVGRIQIEKATILSPSVEIQLPAVQKSADAPIGVPSGLNTSAIRSALSHLPHGMHILVKQGDVNLVRQGRSIGRFDALELQADDAGELLRLRLQGRSNFCRTFQADAELIKASLNLKGRADFSGLMPAAALAALRPDHNGVLKLSATANVHLTFESEGLQTLRCGVNASAPSIAIHRGADEVQFQEVFLEGHLQFAQRRLQAALSQLKMTAPRLQVSGTLNWALASADQPAAIHLALQARNGDVTAWRAATLALAPKLAQWTLLDIVRGGDVNNLNFDAAGASWQAIGNLANLKISGAAGDALIHVPGVDLDLTAVNGDWRLADGVLKVDKATARLGNSQATQADLYLGLVGKRHPIDLRLALKADLAQLPPLLIKVLPEPAIQEELKRIRSLQGNALGQLNLNGTLEAMMIAVNARDIRLKADYDRLPAPIEVKRGQFQYDDQGIRLIQVQADMDDTRIAKLDARIAFKKTLSLQGSVQGAIGKQLLQWAEDRFKLPADFKPKAPVVIKGLDFSWQSNARLAMAGTLGLANDLQAGIRFTMGPDFFDLSQLTLTDARSNARITLRHDTAQKTWDGGFDGVLDSSTLAGIWQKKGPQKTGWVKGRFAAHVSMAAPGRSTVTGALQAGDLLLPMGAMGTVRLHHADLTTGARKLTIGELDLSWHQQQVSLAGEIHFADQSVQMDLTANSDRLDLGEIEKIFQNAKPGKNGPKPKTAHQKIPITGNIQIKAGQVVYGPHRWEPVQATLQLAPEQVTIVVDQAEICGLETLGTLKWSPQGLWLELIPKAVHQKLQISGGCFSGAQSTERIEGIFNVAGKITTHGTNRDALLQHMQGWINFDAADGQFSNAGEVGLLTNILAYLRINRLITGDVPDLKQRAFKYNKILLKLPIHDGKVYFQQAEVRSETLNLVAEGDIDLASRQLALVVLVSPLTAIDTIVRNIPVVGKILKGTLIAIPVGVRGPMDNPRVIPLSPQAVGDRLKGILERTLEAPFQLVEPLLKPDQGSENAPGEKKNGGNSP